MRLTSRGWRILGVTLTLAATGWLGTITTLAERITR